MARRALKSERQTVFCKYLAALVGMKQPGDLEGEHLEKHAAEFGFRSIGGRDGGVGWKGEVVDSLLEHEFFLFQVVDLDVNRGPAAIERRASR